MKNLLTFAVLVLCSSPSFGLLNRTVRLYRLFRASTDDHFYTISLAESTNASDNLGYAREGTACFVGGTSALCNSKPVYRLYKGGSKDDHFYTMSDAEANAATSQGYAREGIAFYCMNSAVCGATKPLYRYYRGQEHFYTTDLNEGNNSGGRYEGILCYVWPSESYH